MTDLESFIATTEHRRPGRILYTCDFTPDLNRRLVEHTGTENLESHYGMMAQVRVGLKPPEGFEAIDYSRYWAHDDLPEGTTIDGIGVAHTPSGFYHFTGYLSPLRNATNIAEIEDYPLDDVGTWDGSHLAGEVQQAHTEGKAAVCWVGHMYEDSWQIRGYEPFLMDMIERPAWAQCLLDRLAERNRTNAVAAASAGADMIICGDDVANQNAMMFAPETWRTMMLSRWAKVWAEVKQANPDSRIWYHSDGNIFAIVGDLIDAGVDILNPLQPECLDVDEVHRRYGDRVSLHGCIGTQSTMPFGSAEDVRARVKDIIERYGSNGGLIIAPTHILEPEVPLANIDALFDACREYGTFE